MLLGSFVTSLANFATARLALVIWCLHSGHPYLKAIWAYPVSDLPAGSKYAEKKSIVLAKLFNKGTYALGQE